jgi:hypothetical protein
MTKKDQPNQKLKGIKMEYELNNNEEECIKKRNEIEKEIYYHE